MANEKQLATKTGKGSAAHEKRKAHIARMKEYGLDVNDLHQLKAALVALDDHRASIVQVMETRGETIMAQVDAVRRAIAFLVDG